MRNDDLMRGYEPVVRKRKTGWWEVEGLSGDTRPSIHGRKPESDDQEIGQETIRGKKSEPAYNASSDLPQIEEPTTIPLQSRSIRKLQLARRGHLISFYGLFLFTAVLYFRPYELSPAFAGLASLAFWIAAATLAVFLPSQLMIEGNLTARPREVNLVLLLFLAGLLSVPFAIDRTEAWATFSDSFAKAIAMFIVLINVVRTERRLKAMLLLALSVGFVLSFAALRDFYQGNLTIEGYRVNGSIGGMFANPNDMALYLMTAVPIAVALFFIARNTLAKLVYAALTLLLVGGIMVTYSRGAFLGLVAVVAVFAWKMGKRNRLLISATGLLGGALFIALAPGGYGKRLLSIFFPNLDAVGSSTARKELLMRSLVVAARHPLLGIGIGNFHIVGIHEHVSHNAYTQVAAEMGLFATAVYVLYMIFALRRLMKVESETFDDSRRQASSYYLAVGLQASIIGYMVTSFFASVAYQWYIYYLVGFAVVLGRMYDETRKKDNSPCEIGIVNSTQLTGT